MDYKRKDLPDPKRPPKKGTASNSYRPITCLQMIWKILTAQISEKIYYSLISRRLLPEGQKGPEEQESYYTLINVSPRTAKRDEKKLSMAWIDYKKTYDLVPQSWIIDCLIMYKISGLVIKFIKNTMENCRVELTSGEKSLAKVKIQRRIFKRDVLSPLLSVITYLRIAQVNTYFINHKKNQPPYVHGRHQMVCQKWKRIGHLNSGSKDIQYRYREWFWPRKMIEGIELPNQEKIKTLGETETNK